MAHDSDVLNWELFLSESLSKLDQANLRRVRQVTLPTSSAAMISRHGRAVVNFGGNDYLGLRNHPKMVQAVIAATLSNGIGSGASPAVTGYALLQQQLECELASFSHLPSALVFSSGFSGNLATLSSLVSQEDAIFSDSLNHASLIDGCRLTKARRIIYPHADIVFLEKTLRAERARYRRVLIVSESIFSMDGDAAPLAELAELAKNFNCGLIVDEAHATGVYGNTGAGLLEELGLEQHVLAKLGTMSKAMGNVGGFVCGSAPLVDFVMNFGRSYMYSTALPSSALAGASAALKLIREMQSQRETIRHMAITLRQKLREQGWRVLGTDSPIVPLVLGSEQAALELSARLFEAGLFVPAIRPPTVPSGTSRLRISLSISHSSTQIDDLVATLCRLG